MSIETLSPESDSLEQWDALRRKATRVNKVASSSTVFGKAAKGGSVYRWGMAVAIGAGCQPEVEVLSRIACDEPLGKKLQSFDVDAEAEAFIDTIEAGSLIDVIEASKAVTWAAALPELCRTLPPRLSWRLLTALRQLHESVSSRNQTSSAIHLILVGELGLTLAWRMTDVPSCRLLQKCSLAAISDWCENYEHSVADAVTGATYARLVLASLIRCQALMDKTAKRKFKKQQNATADLLATWVTAMTLETGGSALSIATRKNVDDDLKEDGLLERATRFDEETLRPAIAAALGENQTGGRLAWEVSLPETFWHDADAKLAILLPEWDVRRGRTHLDYSGENVAIEVFAGRTKVIDGVWQTMIELDGEEQQPCGPWTEVCEYTDDDVHYLEIEQAWTGGLSLQRQVLLVREDRCLLTADAIVPDGTDRSLISNSEDGENDLARKIRYWSRLPIAAGIETDPEPETRELFLSDGRRRAMVLPISAGEWRIGPSSASLTASDDGHLVIAGHGNGRLYCPMWIDFAQRRFKRKRTWRQLTVVNDLRLCPKNEAAGFRIQVGSEQWMVYRTLGDARTRSILGKHLIADFFVSRFDPTYGDHDSLITVDDEAPNDD